MLPPSLRTSAAYLGGGIARGIEQKAGQIAQAGQKVVEATKSPVGKKVGQFLETVGSQAKQAATSVGTQGAMGKRDVGLAAMGTAMAGAFVGGMGANAGIYALSDYFSKDPQRAKASDVPTIGGNVMPSNLQLGYTQLNQMGSPLGAMNLQNVSAVKSAQVNQRLLRAALGPEFASSEE